MEKKKRKRRSNLSTRKKGKKNYPLPEIVLQESSCSCDSSEDEDHNTCPAPPVLDLNSSTQTIDFSAQFRPATNDAQNQTENIHLNEEENTALRLFLNNMFLVPLIQVLVRNKLFDAFMTLVVSLGRGLLSCKNIALLCVFDAARFACCGNTVRMRYFKETKEFWSVVYHVLGGIAERLFGGPKNTGQVVSLETTRGIYDPQESNSNFIVPGSKILAKSITPYPTEVMPGIIRSSVDIIKAKAEQGKEFILSVDGKKVGQGVRGKRYGDIDLWGVQNTTNLTDKLNELEAQKRVASRMAEEIIPCSIEEHYDRCFRLLYILSHRLKDVTSMTVQQELLKERQQNFFINNPGEAVKYTYSISRIKVKIHQLKRVSKTGVDLAGKMLKLLSKFKRTSSMFHRTVDPNCPLDVASPHVANCWRMLPTDYISPELLHNPKFVKQGSAQWLANRRLSPITGSTVHDALCLSTIQLTTEHILYHVRGQPRPPFPQDVRLRMEHGKDNEINAVATIAGLVVPAIFPKCAALFEVSSAFIDGIQRHNLFQVSADGVIKCTRPECEHTHEKYHEDIVVEIKCPYPDTVWGRKPHYEVPSRYVCQLMCGMAAHNATKCMYVCYTEKSTTVHMVTFDDMMWQKMLTLADQMYGGDNINIPTRVPALAHELRSDIKKFVRTNCEFLLEVPSIKGCEVSHLGMENTPYGMKYLPDEEIHDFVNMNIHSTILSEELQDFLQDCYAALRQNATQLQAFMISDTDRIYETECIPSVPLAYALSGDSLKPMTMRSMVDVCRNVLKEYNIPVLCETYDGQWMQLCVKTKYNKSLTRLGLQADSWSKVSGKGKKTLIQFIHSISSVSPSTQKKLANTSLQSGQEFSEGNCSVARYKDMVALKSRGGNIFPSEVIYLLQTKAHAKSWKFGPEDNQQNTSAPRGLQPGERTLVDIIPVHVIPNIQAIRQTQNSLHTVLTHAKILQDILSALLDINTPKWQNVGLHQLYPSILASASELRKLRKDEAKVILEAIEQWISRKLFYRNALKSILINLIGQLFNSNEVPFPELNQEEEVNNPETLRDMCASLLGSNKYPVNALRCAVASLHHHFAKKEWESSATVPLYVDLPNKKNIRLHSYPEYSYTRKQLEPRTLDPSHVLTNCRAHILGKGYDFATQDMFKAVSKKNPTVLSHALVLDALDKQSVPIAKRMFGPPVQAILRQLGYTDCADFVELLMNWYSACDKRGISCNARIEALYNMHEYLNSLTDLDSFPAVGSHINGIPWQTFEALLQSISTRITLYSLSLHSTYNHRCVSTLPNETYFASLTELDRQNICPKAAGVPQVIGKAAQLDYYKYKPNKAFTFHTSTRKVYPVRTDIIVPQDKRADKKCDQFVDHPFDFVNLNRPNPRKRTDDVSTGNAPLRGVTGVRKIGGHSINEEKVLPEHLHSIIFD